MQVSYGQLRCKTGYGHALADYFSVDFEHGKAGTIHFSWCTLPSSALKSAPILYIDILRGEVDSYNLECNRSNII